jgi:hypothetical protein
VRPLEERSEVRRHAESGLNPCQIARLSGIPRSTIRDWLESRVPAEGAESCQRCGHAVHDFGALPEADYALLLGFYLGDGTISRARKGIYALRIFNDNRYPAVTAESALAMVAVMPRNRVQFVQRRGCIEISSWSKAWPCLFPQHGPGPKHQRPIYLAAWQSEIVTRRPHQFVRGLLLSDGCRITNFATTKGGRGRYEYPRYFFSNASDDIRELFCRSLDQLRVAYTQPSPRVISIARASSVRFLDGFVGAKA